VTPDPAQAAPPFFALVAGDLRQLAKLKEGASSIATRLWFVDVLMLPGAWAGILWRAGTTLHARGLRPLSRICYFLNVVLFGAELASGATVEEGMTTPHPVGVTIASGTQFGKRCRVMGKVSIGGSGNPDAEGHPVIGDDVWIFDAARVFGPVKIGDRSIIGAGVTVTRDIPADSFVTADSGLRIRSLEEVGLETHGGSLDGGAGRWG